jgi:hypothetical protein
VKRVRIGVTGHRRFDDHALAREMTSHVLDRLLPDGNPVTVVSSLAEGGDRLVAELCLARSGSELHVVLPLRRDDYLRDFSAAESRHEFDALMARAESVEVVEQRAGDTREDAYQRAGRAVVDAVDVVVALWDGASSRGQGGTAEIIQYALDRDVLVEVVLVTRSVAD